MALRSSPSGSRGVVGFARLAQWAGRGAARVIERRFGRWRRVVAGPGL